MFFSNLPKKLLQLHVSDPYLLLERDTVLSIKVTSHNNEQKKKMRGGFFPLICLLLWALFPLESPATPKLVQALVSGL